MKVSNELKNKINQDMENDYNRAAQDKHNRVIEISVLDKKLDSELSRLNEKELSDIKHSASNVNISSETKKELAGLTQEFGDN